MGWEKPGNIGDMPDDEKAMKNALDPVYRKKVQSSIKPKFSTIYARKNYKSSSGKDHLKVDFYQGSDSYSQHI